MSHDEMHLVLQKLLHAGADPLETIQKNLSLLAYIKLNFMGNIYVGEFLKKWSFTLRNLNSKNAQIFGSGFFPNFPDPIFSRKKWSLICSMI